uniref:Uncharacterized protein n=1 Tax=Anguilla anguilla TaxID=7936 RepID=A0A0E9RLK2_ANGAN
MADTNSQTHIFISLNVILHMNFFGKSNYYLISSVLLWL